MDFELCVTFIAIAVIIAGLQYIRWKETRRDYDTGIRMLKWVLDLPLQEWENKYRGTMSENEWFGFQRGFAQGQLDALVYLGETKPPPLHTNRYEPRPEKVEHEM